MSTRQPIAINELAEAIYLARVLGGLDLALELKVATPTAKQRTTRITAAQKDIGGRLRALVTRLGFDADLFTELMASVHVAEAKLRAERRGQPRGSRLH